MALLQQVKCRDDLSGRLARWFEQIGSYNCTFRHVKGVLNSIPDFLSRMFENTKDSEQQPATGKSQTPNATHSRGDTQYASEVMSDACALSQQDKDTEIMVETSSTTQGIQTECDHVGTIAHVMPFTNEEVPDIDMDRVTTKFTPINTSCHMIR